MIVYLLMIIMAHNGPSKDGINNINIETAVYKNKADCLKQRELNIKRLSEKFNALSVECVKEDLK